MAELFVQHRSACRHARLRGAVCLDCGDWQIVSCSRCESVMFNVGQIRRPPLACSACGAAYAWVQEAR